MASTFFKDIVRYLNISDKQNAECIQEFCGRLQVGQMCYQKKLHDIVFEQDILQQHQTIRYVRVSVVTSTQRIHTPWRRSQQQRFDPNREVIKLKFKVWNTVQRTYSKYYVDYRSPDVVGLSDLREMALKEVRRMVNDQADVHWFPQRNGARKE